MADDAAPNGKAGEAVVAAPAAAEKATAETASQSVLPPSPLSTADAAKHADGEAAKTDSAKTDSAKTESADKSAAETKPAETKPASESAAESGSVPPAEAKPEGDKPGETKVEAEAKPDGEAKPEAADDGAPKEPPRQVTFDAYKVPEGFKLDQGSIEKFNGILAKAEVSGKADHSVLQTAGQELVDLYRGEVERIGKEVAQNQVTVWNRLVEQRVNELKNDPDLGGNRIETTLGNAKYALESLMPEVSKNLPVPFTKQDATDLIRIMDAGGVSHSRLTIKLLNAFYELLREPEPVPANLPLSATTPKEPGQRGWYDKVDGGRAA